MTRILFVCMGNICRSPMAEGAFRKLIVGQNGFHVESAGTIGYHQGHPPDERAQHTASLRGMDLSAQRARKVRLSDFDSFDYILAMDKDNLRDLKDMAPIGSGAKISLLLNHCESQMKEVPDPYYGGNDGFEHCLDLIEMGVVGFFKYVKNKPAL